MAIQKLSRYIGELEAYNELVRIKPKVDPVLEIAELADRVMKSKDGGKALLFENTGTDFPLLINAYGSDKRMALALGFQSLDEAKNEVGNLIRELLSPPSNLISKIGMLPKLARLSSYFPSFKRGRGECQECVMEIPDLSKLPVLKCWPGDGGRFITLPMVITKNPENGIRNVGMYRMQVIDNKTTAMHWHPHKTGALHFQQYKSMNRKMPIAVALGGGPILAYAATAPLPGNIDEFIFAGLIRKKKVRLVKCLTQDIEVPAEADIVIEGFIDPAEEFFLEGPFGDHTGFYSLPGYFPKFHVTCITYRKDAVYPATIVGIPPMEDAWIARATEKLFIIPVRLGLLPEIRDMHLPAEGVAHNLTLVSIEKGYEGHAQKVMNALWGTGQMMFNKIMIVFNKEVNLSDYLGLARSAMKQFNPLTGIYFGQGPLDILDHASSKMGFGSKIGIDCTNDQNIQPVAIQVLNPDTPREVYDQIKEIQKINISLYNEDIPVLMIGISNTDGPRFKMIIERLLSIKAFAGCKMILAVDAELDISNISMVIWYCLNNIDPRRDIFVYEGAPCMIVNGLNKHHITGEHGRQWPNVIVADTGTIETIDNIWKGLGLGDIIMSPSLAVKGINNHDGAFYNGSSE